MKRLFGVPVALITLIVLIVLARAAPDGFIDIKTHNPADFSCFFLPAIHSVEQDDIIVQTEPNGGAFCQLPTWTPTPEATSTPNPPEVRSTTTAEPTVEPSPTACYDDDSLNHDCDDDGGATATICHKPGTPAEKTMVIPLPALSGHLGHGDHEGECA